MHHSYEILIFFFSLFSMVREVINNREGGGYKMAGGQVKFYPYKKRGRKKSFSHAEGGGGAQQVLR